MLIHVMYKRNDILRFLASYFLKESNVIRHMDSWIQIDRKFNVVFVFEVKIVTLPIDSSEWLPKTCTSPDQSLLLVKKIHLESCDCCKSQWIYRTKRRVSVPWGIYVSKNPLGRDFVSNCATILSHILLMLVQTN